MRSVTNAARRDSHAYDAGGQLNGSLEETHEGREILENRRALAERVRTGDLRLPGAVAEIRKGFGMTQEEFARTLALTTASC